MTSWVKPLIGWTLLIGFVVLLAWKDAHAYKLRLDDCGQFAQIVYNFGQVRDMGADQSKHWAVVKRLSEGSTDAWIRLLHRELRRVYREPAITPDDLKAEAYARCIRNLGDLGDGI